MKRRTLWSVVLLGGLMALLPSAQSAHGQTTVVYSPPAYRTSYYGPGVYGPGVYGPGVYGPRAVYPPAYSAYRPTFFQAVFGPLVGYYPGYSPAYGYRPAYYPLPTRTSFYGVPPVVGRVPVTSPSYDTLPCPTACSPCGIAGDNASSAAGTRKPVPDKHASQSAAGQPRTYSERKPPLPDAKPKSPDRFKLDQSQPAKPAKKTRTKKPALLPAGDSPFEPTRPRKKNVESPAFPEPKTGAVGNPRERETRKLAPPIVIQQRKEKRPPVTEPANENDPFGQRRTKPGTTNQNKTKQPDTTSSEKQPAASGTQTTADVQPLHLDGRVTWRTVPRRLSVRPSQFGMPPIERAFRSNQHWISMPNGNQMAGPVRR